MIIHYLSQYFPIDIANIIDVYMMFLNFEEVIIHSQKIHNKKIINKYLKNECHIGNNIIFQYDLKIYNIIQKSTFIYENRKTNICKYYAREKVTEIIKYLNYFIIFKYSDSNRNTDPMIFIPDNTLKFLNDYTTIVHMYDFDINKYI
jgi:hypothetical protein